jgi:hypothetical protein
MKNTFTKFLMGVLIGLTSAGSTAFAQAAPTGLKLVSSSWWKEKTYSAGDMFQHKFEKPTYMENMVITAIGGANRYAEAEVWIDGTFYSRIGVPPHDPNYPVYVRKEVSTVQIKFLGSIRINEISMFVKEGYNPRRSDYNSLVLNSTAELAEQAKSIVSDLHDRLLDKAFRDNMIPIRKQAIFLKATANARGESDPATRTKAFELVRALDSASSLFDEMIYGETYSEDVQNLLMIKEILKQKFAL